MGFLFSLLLVLVPPASAQLTLDGDVPWVVADAHRVPSEPKTDIPADNAVMMVCFCLPACWAHALPATLPIAAVSVFRSPRSRNPERLLLNCRRQSAHSTLPPSPTPLRSGAARCRARLVQGARLPCSHIQQQQLEPNNIPCHRHIACSFLWRCHYRCMVGGCVQPLCRGVSKPHAACCMLHA